jgi:hypothetical protein
MHIGIDFDNTIVNYDPIFHLLAREKALIPNNLPIDRLAVRDYLRNIDNEPAWTAMQGEVYGARMLEATAHPHVIDWMHRMKEVGHAISIVSHKTKHPYLGPAYDLHKAARAWIRQYLNKNNLPLFTDNQIFFELTKEEKISRIKEINCDLFIDDLPEILLSPQFPHQIKRVLFDPKKHHEALGNSNIHIISSFSNFTTESEIYHL